MTKPKSSTATEETKPQSTLKHSASSSDLSEEDADGDGQKFYKVKRSKALSLINWSHVAYTYFPTLFLLLLSLTTLTFLNQLLKLPNLKHLFTTSIDDVIDNYNPIIFTAGLKGLILAAGVIYYLASSDKPVYLVDFHCFEPPESWKCSHAQIIEMMRLRKCFSQSSLDFMERILARSATGQKTAWPPGIVQSLNGVDKADCSIKKSREEAEFVISDCVEGALKKSNLKATDIDILIINCSLFSPTPSLCAMVVSKFGLRQDIASYNLSGMGCAASLISIDLAKKLLTNRSSKGVALVISTEVITPNLYTGNDKSYLLQNTLFRCGGAGIVLTNDWHAGLRSQFKLLNTVRVQGNTQEDYNCVFESEDLDGNRGVTLSKEIVNVAGKCMEKNLTELGPSILPLSEQIPVVVSMVARFGCKKIQKLLYSIGMNSWAKKIPAVRSYIPDFKRSVDHFCIHAGGRAVIDGIEKNLKLSPYHTEPSRMTLETYGNTSSSSIWYELDYIRSRQKSNPMGEGIRKGERVLMVGFGSGFKCTSGVWLKL